jgi:hypothetical protein
MFTGIEYTATKEKSLVVRAPKNALTRWRSRKAGLSSLSEETTFMFCDFCVDKPKTGAHTLSNRR